MNRTDRRPKRGRRKPPPPPRRKRRIALPVGLAVAVIAAIGGLLGGYLHDRPVGTHPNVHKTGVDLQGLHKVLTPELRNLLTKPIASLQKHPQDPAAYGRLGRALHEARAFDAARWCYEKAFLLEPTNFAWPYYLARLDAQHGRREPAIAHYQQAVNLNPDYAPAYLHLGETLIETGKLPEAEEAIARFVKRAPDEPAGLVALGRLARARHQLPLARRYLEQAIQTDPTCGPGHYQLGLVLRDLGEADLARKHLADSQQLRFQRQPFDPLMQQVHAAGASYQNLLERAEQATREGRTDQALATCARLIQQYPNDPHVHYVAGWICLRSNDLRQAEKHLRHAIALDPRFVDAMSLLASTLIRAGKMAESEAWYHKAIGLRPEDPELYHNHAAALLAVQQVDEAIADFRQAALRDADNPERHRRLGFLLMRVGRNAEAVEAMRAAVRSGPHDPIYWVALGRALIEVNNSDEAEASLLEAIRLKPGDGEAHFHLACLYARLGRRDEAFAALQNSVRLRFATRALCDETLVLTVLRVDPRYQALFSAPAPGRR